MSFFTNKSRLKDLKLEGRIARTTTPEIRLKLAFELLELAENLYQASRIEMENKIDEY